MKRSCLGACLLVAACFSEDDVDESGADDHGTTHAESSSTATASATTATETSGLPTSTDDGSESVDTTADAPGCGDMMVGPDEDCDDGNDVPGDGCSACRVTGTLLWTQTLGMPGLRDDCYAVSLREHVIVVGDLSEAPDVYNGWVEAFDREGTPAWRFDDDDDTSSGFRALAWIDAQEFVAVGIHNNIGLVAGDGWAKRFTAGGVSGLEQELTWHDDMRLSGFVGVSTTGNDLVLAANVYLDGAYRAWYGALPLDQYPEPAFSAESMGIDPGVLIEGFDHGGARLRGLERHFSGTPNPLSLSAFEGTIVDPPATYDLGASAATVVIAVDGSGRTWTCGSSDTASPRALQLGRVAASLDETAGQTHALDGDATCHAITTVGEGAVLAARVDATTLMLIEVDDQLEIVWSTTLDVGAAVPRSIALDEAGEAIALCGVLPDGGEPAMDDAWIALVVR
ncbi:MAG TPA: DUF4215 domain-containing protein [Nannocystaceae bacterium]|nr:DUF4215 domain-containing protein [Nannocystaceae bacterium]